MYVSKTFFFEFTVIEPFRKVVRGFVLTKEVEVLDFPDIDLLSYYIILIFSFIKDLGDYLTL